MTEDADYREALAYFTTARHEASFEALMGPGRVVFSAPHAVTQLRDGRVKPAERYTGVLARLLHSREGFPCLMKTRDMGDDANHDARSPYRDRLCELVRETGARFVLDLHQLAQRRPMALCVGTGRGANLCGRDAAVPVVAAAFERRGLAPVTLDDPFAAATPHTVSATVAARLSVPALQLELNTNRLQEGCKERDFAGVLDALTEVARALERL